MQTPAVIEGNRVPERQESDTGSSHPIVNLCRKVLGDSRTAYWLFPTLFAVAIMARLGQTINNDVGWYLYSAGAWLDGGRLYKDIFFEVNPPLALFIATPAVFLAKLTGLSPAHVYFTYIFALIGISLALFSRILAQLVPTSPLRRHGLTVAAFLTLAIAPAGDFGQREHLTMILILPFLALSAHRAAGGASGRSLATIAGVSAALGFAVKPHFLVPWLAVELYLMVRRRSLSTVFQPETTALAATGLLYGACILLVTPDYLTSIVPYALEVYNANYRNPLDFVLARKETFLVPLTVLFFFLIRRQLDRHELGDVFVISATCFFAVYVIQMKGWNYQIYPTTALLIMSFAASVAGARPGTKATFRADQDWLDPRDGSSQSCESARHTNSRPDSRGWSERQGRFHPTAIWPGCVRKKSRYSLTNLAGLMMIGMLLLKPALIAGNFYPLTNYLKPLVEKNANSQPVYFFSSNTWTGFPLVNYSNVVWASRFPALWLLPALVNERSSRSEATSDERRATLAKIENFVRQAVMEDLTRYRPALIMVDGRRDKQWYSEPGFDFIDFFSADVCFRKLWSRYEKIDDHNGWQVYRLRNTASHEAFTCQSPGFPVAGD